MSFPAPIIQLLLTVQFQPPALSLTVVDWAELRAMFLDEYPVFTQIPRAGSMPARLDEVVIEPQFGSPRFHIASSDLTSLIMVQDDRISVGWSRAAPLSSDPLYPGFTATLQRATAVFEKVLAFISERSSVEVIPAVGEVSYIDAFIVMQDGEQVRKLEEVFTCTRSIPDFRFQRLNLTYQRHINSENEDGLTGSSETTISGLVPYADGSVTANLQTVVRFVLTGFEQRALTSRFEQAQEEAKRIFKVLVKPEGYSMLGQP